MLETQRLILKPGTIADAPFLLKLNSDPEVVRYTGDETLLNLAGAEKQLKERIIFQYEKYQMGRFSVFLKDGLYIGWCGLRYFPQTNEVDLGYRFMKKYWGQGYASESATASLRYGFETLGLKKIVAKAMPENVASIKVMVKLKMTFRGLIKDPTEPLPLVLYDMTNNEFKQCGK